MTASIGPRRTALQLPKYAVGIYRCWNCGGSPDRVIKTYEDKERYYSKFRRVKLYSRVCHACWQAGIQGHPVGSAKKSFTPVLPGYLLADLLKSQREAERKVAKANELGLGREPIGPLKEEKDDNFISNRRSNLGSNPGTESK